MKDAAETMFTKVYKQEQLKVSRQLKRQIAFTPRDLGILATINTQPVLTQAFAGITNKLAEDIRAILTKQIINPEGISLSNISKELQRATEIAGSKADLIARIEVGNVAAAARRQSYKQADPNGEFLYIHIGPKDGRTTSTSARIKKRTKKGVPWQEYLRIVKQESAKDFPTWTVNDEYPVSHWNSRHIFSRVVKK